MFLDLFRVHLLNSVRTGTASCPWSPSRVPFPTWTSFSLGLLWFPIFYIGRYWQHLLLSKMFCLMLTNCRTNMNKSQETIEHVLASKYNCRSHDLPIHRATNEGPPALAPWNRLTVKLAGVLLTASKKRWSCPRSHGCPPSKRRSPRGFLWKIWEFLRPAMGNIWQLSPTSWGARPLYSSVFSLNLLYTTRYDVTFDIECNAVCSTKNTTLFFLLNKSVFACVSLTNNWLHRKPGCDPVNLSAITYLWQVLQ